MRLSECARDRIVLGRRGMVAGEMGLTRWRKLGDHTQEAWWHAAVRVCSGSNGAREARHDGRRDGVDAMDVFAKTPGLWGVAQRSCSIWDFRVWAFLKDPRKVLSLASHAARTTHAKPTKPRNRETSRASIKGPRRAPGFLHCVPRAPPTQNPTKQRNSETDRGG